MSNTDTATTAKGDATDVVRFTILLNGEAIKGEYRIHSLSVAKSFNKISSAKIVIADGDVARQDFPISSNEEGLVPGSEIEISMGYHAREKKIFKGIITKHSIKSGKGRHSLLTLEMKDKAVKLTKGRKSLGFVDKTDAEMIESIAIKSGYAKSDLDIPSGMLKHKEMVQYNTIDWDFIVSRAEMNGMIVLTDDNKLVIKVPDTNQESSKEITYGVEIIEFESEIDADSQLKQVMSHSWSYKDQKAQDSPEAKIKFKESGNLQAEKLAGSLGANELSLNHTGSLDNDELKAWSNAQLLKSRLAKTIGTLKIKGTNDVLVGQVIKLTGFSKRFNGNVLVSGIKHSYTKSQWETDIQFGFSEQWFYHRDDIVEKPASGLVPGINGLQIGIVMQLESDPDNEHRIKIQLPLVEMKDGIWARVACLDAGNERGSFFRPEINDEVVVGFFNDDPRHAVVLGMLNSSAKPAPVTAKDVNHEKGFVTRSKMKLMFDDDKKIITLETPKGKKIEINDDSDSIVLSDNHQNKISMTSDGISIESLKNIIIKTSGGDVKTEGLNIDSKANVKYSAQGSANAEFKSTGPTIIKGAIVNIN
ncbi:MAG: type VI secretion system tip protein VgrG [Ferruginibacter sp.]